MPIIVTLRKKLDNSNELEFDPNPVPVEIDDASPNQSGLIQWVLGEGLTGGTLEIHFSNNELGSLATPFKGDGKYKVSGETPTESAELIEELFAAPTESLLGGEAAALPWADEPGGDAEAIDFSYTGVYQDGGGNLAVPAVAGVVRPRRRGPH